MKNIKKNIRHCIYLDVKRRFTKNIGNINSRNLLLELADYFISDYLSLKDGGTVFIRGVSLDGSNSLEFIKILQVLITKDNGTGFLRVLDKLRNENSLKGNLDILDYFLIKTIKYWVLVDKTLILNFYYKNNLSRRLVSSLISELDHVRQTGLFQTDNPAATLFYKLLTAINPVEYLSILEEMIEYTRTSGFKTFPSFLCPFVRDLYSRLPPSDHYKFNKIVNSLGKGRYKGYWLGFVK
jgi:hypothetical protein